MTLSLKQLIERFKIHNKWNAQSLTPTLSQRERVRTAELAVASSGKINKHTLHHLFAAGLLAGTCAAQASSSGVVISQVYGGSGSSGLARDYVELFNASTAPVDVSGWSVQYASATGSGTFASNGVSALPAGTVIAARSYVLVALGPTAAGTALPSPLISGAAGTNLSSSNGKVVLVNTSTGLACNGSTAQPCTPAQAAQIVDLVGYGSANFFEGAAAPVLNASSALLRAAEGCTDSDNNASDFALGAPTPRTSASAPATCSGGGGGGPTVVAIPAIQGTGITSPRVGTSVTTEGVVTAVFPGLRGFYLQDPSGDGDPLSSDGIFVFEANSPLGVAVGERIRITANVVEFAGFTGNPSVTQLSSPSGLTRLGTGSVTPTPISLPETTEGDLERYEGMLVRITNALSVSQNFFQGRYGQVSLAAQGRLIKPTQLFRPGTPQAMAQAEENARRRIVLDDGSASESFFSGVENPNPIPYIGADNTLRAGDTVADLTGVIDFGRITSATGAEAIVDYKLHPTVPPVFTRVNNRNATPPAVGGSLKVASFNVLNYFTTFGDGTSASGGSGLGCLPGNTAADCRGADNATEFARQRNKIIAALAALNADVVGLIELQRNGNVAVQNLVDGLNAVLGAGTYAVVPDPATGVGTDAIKVGFIYKPASVALVGAALSDTSAVHDRPPVAQTFRAVAAPLNNARFSVIVTHFKSKRCNDAAGLDLDAGDGQGCYNERRKQQAQALLTFASSVQAAAADNDVLLVGDLNSYAQEDPIDLLVQAGWANQLLRFAPTPASSYSFVFDGEQGALDHALASPSLAPQITGAADWHINADEPSVIDYNTESKPQDFYTPTPYRSADHDPLVVGLALAPPLTAQTITFAALADRPYSPGATALQATASSGLPVVFSSTTPSVCSVSGAQLTLLNAGLCTVNANQAGSASFAPAPQVARSFTVLQAAQSISFGPLPPLSLGAAAVSLNATASSGLPVTWQSLSASVCSVSAQGLLTVLSAGTCTVQATQAGDSRYLAAAPVQQSAVVAAADADVPLPGWALLLMALGLIGAARRP
jgi:uncharacterized protein